MTEPVTVIVPAYNERKTIAAADEVEGLRLANVRVVRVPAGGSTCGGVDVDDSVGADKAFAFRAARAMLPLTEPRVSANRFRSFRGAYLALRIGRSDLDLAVPGWTRFKP